MFSCPALSLFLLFCFLSLSPSCTVLLSPYCSFLFSFSLSSCSALFSPLLLFYSSLSLLFFSNVSLALQFLFAISPFSSVSSVLCSPVLLSFLPCSPIVLSPSPVLLFSSPFPVLLFCLVPAHLFLPSHSVCSSQFTVNTKFLNFTLGSRHSCFRSCVPGWTARPSSPAAVSPSL